MPEIPSFKLWSRIWVSAFGGQRKVPVLSYPTVSCRIYRRRIIQ